MKRQKTGEHTGFVYGCNKDILLHIFGFLGFWERWELIRVCKDWKRIISSSVFELPRDLCQNLYVFRDCPLKCLYERNVASSQLSDLKLWKNTLLDVSLPANIGALNQNLEVLKELSHLASFSGKGIDLQCLEYLPRNLKHLSLQNPHSKQQFASYAENFRKSVALTSLSLGGGSMVLQYNGVVRTLGLEGLVPKMLSDSLHAISLDNIGLTKTLLTKLSGKKSFYCSSFLLVKDYSPLSVAQFGRIVIVDADKTCSFSCVFQIIAQTSRSMQSIFFSFLS